jgi:hypothetical protein
MHGANRMNGHFPRDNIDRRLEILARPLRKMIQQLALIDHHVYVNFTDLPEAPAVRAKINQAADALIDARNALEALSTKPTDPFGET